MATRRRNPPPPPTPIPTYRMVWHEAKIACTVAGVISLVLLARRWTQCALGSGTLNQELFAGNLAVGTLMTAVEHRFGGSCATTRSPGSRVPGGTQNEPQAA